jgi:hypothetical protein
MEEKEQQNDDEDERKSAAAVVSETRAHAISAKAEQEDENDKKDDHEVLRERNDTRDVPGKVVSLGRLDASCAQGRGVEAKNINVPDSSGSHRKECSPAAISARRRGR